MERRQLGLTMVEIMVAMGILVIVIAGVMESFVVNNRAYTVVDQTTETQQNIRAVGQLLDQDLRMAGFMTPEGGALCGYDGQNGALPGILPGTDIVYVTDSDAIDPDGQAQANLGGQIASGTPSGGALTLMTDLTVERRPYYDTNADGAADSDFRVGGGVIIMDTSNPARGTACGVVTAVNPSSRLIRFDFESGFTTGGGTLIAIPAHRYAVDTNNQLTRDGVSIVSDVEDLQLAYFIDSNDNGVPDASEYRGDGTAPNYYANGTNHSDLREVRFNIVLRSRQQDENFDEGFMQATENRPATGGTDGYRRRLLTTTVKPRNLGFRGTAS